MRSIIKPLQIVCKSSEDVENAAVMPPHQRNTSPSSGSSASEEIRRTSMGMSYRRSTTAAATASHNSYDESDSNAMLSSQSLSRGFEIFLPASFPRYLKDNPKIPSSVVPAAAAEGKEKRFLTIYIMTTTPHHHSHDVVLSSSSHEEGQQVPETTFEYYSDGLLATAFLIIAILAAKRMFSSRSQGGAETTVVTAFYSLIFLTSTLRGVWFIIPGTMWAPYYTPHAIMAFSSSSSSSTTISKSSTTTTTTAPQWIWEFVEQLLNSAGSLSLFSIFILILVYWADILKKYFYPDARRSKPMHSFLLLISALGAVQIINALLFLHNMYSTTAMALVNSITLSIVSLVCVVEISIFSHRFRSVLQTLGDINQVPTDSQVKRIVYITITGNLFFITRAMLETTFAIKLGMYYKTHGSVDEVFSHGVWDTFLLLKHYSELAILALMLYILQSRFTNSTAAAAAASSNGGGGGESTIRGGGYQSVPETTDLDDETPSKLLAV